MLLFVFVADAVCCFDANVDGLCDAPYVIDGDNTDYLPMYTNQSVFPIICSDCDTCNAAIVAAAISGSEVYLNQSISNQDGNCIDFAGYDSVTFDCDGNTIDGDGDGVGYGIYFNGNFGGSDYNVVRNCKVN